MVQNNTKRRDKSVISFRLPVNLAFLSSVCAKLQRVNLFIVVHRNFF